METTNRNDIVINAIPHHDLQGFFDPTKNDTICIIINDRDREATDPFKDIDSTKILRENFNDVELKDDKFKITDYQAGEIVSWTQSKIAENPNIKNIVVSCEGGVCRSAAVACGLETIINDNKEGAINRWLTHNNYLPNTYVLEKVLAQSNDPELNIKNDDWQQAINENRKRFDATNEIAQFEERACDLAEFEASLPF